MPGRRDFKPDSFKRTPAGHVTVKPGAGGPIWHSLLITADLDEAFVAKLLEDFTQAAGSGMLG